MANTVDILLKIQADNEQLRQTIQLQRQQQQAQREVTDSAKRQAAEQRIAAEQAIAAELRRRETALEAVQFERERVRAAAGGLGATGAIARDNQLLQQQRDIVAGIVALKLRSIPGQDELTRANILREVQRLEQQIARDTARANDEQKRALQDQGRALNEAKSAFTAGNLARAAGIIAGVSFSLAGLFSVVRNGVRDSLQLSETFKQTADRLNDTTDAVQVADFAFRRGGQSIAEAERVANALNRRLDEARAGSTETAENFFRLGLSLEELNRASSVERLVLLGQALKRTEGDAGALDATVEILGNKSQRTFDVLKRFGEVGFERSKEDAAALGQLIDPDLVQRLEKAKQRIDDIRRAWTIGFGEAISHTGDLLDLTFGDALQRVEASIRVIEQQITDANAKLELGADRIGANEFESATRFVRVYTAELEKAKARRDELLSARAAAAPPAAVEDPAAKAAADAARARALAEERANLWLRNNSDELEKQNSELRDALKTDEQRLATLKAQAALLRDAAIDPDGFLIDLSRAKIRNPDGTFSTERTITVQVAELNFGRATNIPTLIDGIEVSAETAIRRAIEAAAKGVEFPNFATVEQAEAAARARSELIATLREGELSEAELMRQQLEGDNRRLTLAKDIGALEEKIAADRLRTEREIAELRARNFELRTADLPAEDRLEILRRRAEQLPLIADERVNALQPDDVSGRQRIHLEFENQRLETLREIAALEKEIADAKTKATQDAVALEVERREIQIDALQRERDQLGERDDLPFLEKRDRINDSLEREIELLREIYNIQAEIAPATEAERLEREKTLAALDARIATLIEANPDPSNRFEDQIRLADSLRDGIGGVTDSLAEAIVAGEDLRGSLSNAFRSIAAEIAAAALRALAFRSIMSAFPAFGSFLGLPALGFARGGYTGAGARHEVAGVVHRGEYVVPKDAVDRTGPAAWASMVHHVRGYADGGLVGAADQVRFMDPSDRTFTAAAAAGAGSMGQGAGPAITVPITNVFEAGVTPMQFLSTLDAFERRVPAIMKDAINRAYLGLR